MRSRYRNQKPPVEIAGYVNRQRWVVDIIRGTEGFRWYSVINDNQGLDEELPWFPDS
jgi:hypothetical protein